MSDISELQKRKDSQFFSQWEEFVDPQLIVASEDCIQRLVDRLIFLGPNPSQDLVQTEIDRCVQEFNQLDSSTENSWICTIEREDIGEVIWSLIDLCGFEGDEEWLRERDW